MTSTAHEPTRLSTCPEWCTRDHADHDADDGMPLHYGPRIGRLGLLMPTLLEGDGLLCSLDPPDAPDDLTADDLRQLAADALAAAEWLEAHR